MEKSKAIEQLFLAASGSADIISKLDPSLVKSKCGLEKTYVAVLVGCPDEGQVLINTGRIGLLSENEVHHTPDHQKLKKLKMFCYSGSDDKYGKPACTHIRIVASNPLLGLSVASITLFTGRSHQIRVHCADLGFPVLGDKLYSTTNPGAQGFMHVASDDIYIERSKKDIGFFHPFQVPCRLQELNSTSTKCWLCQRHLLHSSTLVFDHPHSGERMTFSATPIKWFTRDVKSESPSDDAALRSMIKNACQTTT
ncbi:23S rRNA pseudouridine1911/1915/1917 synthase [Angomonas deanei]|nr:23S rRNA pseudouridine1911/1915/1917 synthase [Angomonas deanei]|eukprot:EPY37766.1 23S rRNA pseudouridine1911/1915/1917 synthase [Angomonas deanei]